MRKYLALLAALVGALALAGSAVSGDGPQLLRLVGVAVTLQPRVSHLNYQIEGQNGTEARLYLVGMNRYLSLTKGTDRYQKTADGLLWTRQITTLYPVKKQQVNVWFRVAKNAPMRGSGSRLCVHFRLIGHRPATATTAEVNENDFDGNYCGTTKQWATPVSQR